MTQAQRIILVAAITGMLVSCAKPPPPPAEATTVISLSSSGQSPSSNEARQVAKQYESRQGYSERTVMTLTYTFHDGTQESTTTTFTTRWAPPNKIHLVVESDDNRLEVVSDGSQMSSRILDPLTNNFDGQLVVRDAPQDISMASLYGITELVDPISPGTMLSALLGAPAGPDATPLSLILKQGRLHEIVNDQASYQVRPSQILNDSDECEIIASEQPEGIYQLWIAKKSRLLRRLEFPIARDNLAPGLTQTELVADFIDTEFNVAADDFVVHAEGQEVSHFVLPPLPLSSDKLGNIIGNIQLKTLHGEDTVPGQGANRVVILTWFNDHPASRLVMQQLEQLRSRSVNASVRFNAVATEPARASEAAELLQSWNVSLPCLVDESAVGRDLLGVQQAPTVVALDADGRLHYFEVGANPNIAADLDVVIQRLLAGQDVAAATVKSSTDARQAYERQLSLARSGHGWIELPSDELPPASQPKHVELKKLWSSADCAEPGCMLIVPGKTKQILVADGWNQLVALDAKGRTIRRIELELPPEEGINLLRAGKDERSRAFIAAAARGGRKAFIFDLAGKRLVQYPQGESIDGHVSDVLPVDAAGGLPILIVAWQEEAGIHAIDLNGRRLWTNRAAKSVSSLSSLTDPRASGARIVVSSNSGSNFLVDTNGRTLRQIQPRQGMLHQLVTWPGSARGFESMLSPDLIPQGDDLGIHCGLAMSADGALLVTGFNRNWDSVWTSALPIGVFRNQIDMPQSINVNGIGPTWILLGPDGSVQLKSADGKFSDRFQVGKHLRGVAALHEGEQSVLLVATDGDVSAYEVTVSPKDE